MHAHFGFVSARSANLRVGQAQTLEMLGQIVYFATKAIGSANTIIAWPKGAFDHEPTGSANMNKGSAKRCMGRAKSSTMPSKAYMHVLKCTWLCFLLVGRAYSLPRTRPVYPQIPTDYFSSHGKNNSIERPEPELEWINQTQFFEYEFRQFGFGSIRLIWV